MRLTLKKITLGLFTAAACTAAVAQADKFPSRPITIVGGFPSGSGVDIYARKIGEGLTAAWNVPVIVDAKTGAGGNIGSDYAA
jgi:tripartite-type tricarboxylate transporter receptor subunit TctC